MRSIIVILLLALALIITAALKAPKIVLSERDVWLGEIVQDSVANCSILVKNGGNVPLIISQVNRSCSCTSADKPANHIVPGDSAMIHVSIKTKGFDIGTFHKHISIVSNDHEYITRVYFSGKIIPGKESENE